MRELLLIGIGTGNPDHLTAAGAAALARADTILVPRKGPDKSDLAELRLALCRHVLGSSADARLRYFDMPVRASEGPYLARVEAWHDATALAWQAALEPDHPEHVALLVWGDPSLYDSTLRIAARLSPAPKITVIPGITALQALTAAHAIPLNDLGAAVTVTTGRRLRDNGWPADADTVAVMLDGACAFRDLPAAEFDIWWGAFLGMENQILAHGPLARMRDEIPPLRARARAEHGWIMDTYLLRRRDTCRTNPLVSSPEPT